MKRFDLRYLCAAPAVVAVLFVGSAALAADCHDNGSFEAWLERFLRNSGKGWISSEYSMLPRSTLTRTPREVTKGRASGRTHEIQRLIGRSLRAVTDLERLGERTIWIDCDVIQADGGTRTASITGAFVALGLALQKLVDAGTLSTAPLAKVPASTTWSGLVWGSVSPVSTSVTSLN